MLAADLVAQLTVLHVYREPYNIAYLRGSPAYASIERDLGDTKDALDRGAVPRLWKKLATSAQLSRPLVGKVGKKGELLHGKAQYARRSRPWDFSDAVLVCSHEVV